MVYCVVGISTDLRSSSVELSCSRYPLLHWLSRRRKPKIATDPTAAARGYRLPAVVVPDKPSVSDRPGCQMANPLDFRRGFPPYMSHIGPPETAMNVVQLNSSHTERRAYSLFSCVHQTDSCGGPHTYNAVGRGGVCQVPALRL
jgi:hypothetical protein